ncbi:MAG: RecQ family ATP-dependent DNA helicase [Candidatus Cloacimonetes bacterium]|nr:RecQ family ATP-dependent DNA helicase [Candidatus Cloacimonadota bacterium]
MPEVRCPLCGSPMIIKIARRGPNAGGKFYSCSRFPKCRGTRSLESLNKDTSVIDSESNTENRVYSKISFPRILRARTRLQSYQVKFFETAALPVDLLEKVNFEEIDKEILKAYSQWRVDFPVIESESQLNEKQTQIISVLDKILNRGKITLISPWLEKDFENKFIPNLQIEYDFSIIDYLINKENQRKINYPWLDSNEEVIFYKEILPNILGNDHMYFVIPQVEISSLLPENIDTLNFQRVDFVIFNPHLQNKLVIEIDGEQHKQSIESDRERDNILKNYNYTVIRIPAREIRNRNGIQLTNLQNILSNNMEETEKKSFSISDKIVNYLHSIKIAHQIQIILLQSIQSGLLDLDDINSWKIIADLDKINLFNKKQSLEILQKSVADFIKILEKISKLYSIKFNKGKPLCFLCSNYNKNKSSNAICISFSDKCSIDLPTFHVQNIYFPYHIANSSLPTTAVAGGLEKPKEKDLEFFLQYLFRKPCFWEGQYDGIIRALQGKDTLLLLPTGAGKSLVYQLASLLLPGRTVVIDPIISLMDDQIDNLSFIGIDRCIAITSQIDDVQDRTRAIELLGQGEYLFVYVSPERFQTVEFRDSLRGLTVHTPIPLIVIDEAHCVSEWGHDFRTAYLNIGRTSRIYCESNGNIPPILALTGTASRSVLKDVQRELQIENFDAIITPKSFDRSNLKFRIIYATSQEKSFRLKGYLGQMLPSLFNITNSTFYNVRGKETYSGLIFCPWVGGEFGVERVSDEIIKDLGVHTAIYSGSAPKDWNSDQYRYHKQRVTKEFKRNKIPILVCTKAFGMGIDKPNIRYTIHFGLSPSIESFYQEAGRAGRNRKTAYCCIIVSNDDHERSNKLLNPNIKIEEINEIVRNVPWEENDDITRALYFHINAFRGIYKERQDVEEILIHLGDISTKEKRILTIPEKILEIAEKEVKKKKDIQKKARGIVEKALHRLLLIGVVSDYTIVYSLNEFTVKLSGKTKEEIIETYGKYIASYLYSRRQTEIEKASKLLSLSHPEFIIEMVSLLLQFIYDVIERGRRSALYEMLLACTDSPTDKAIRQRILRYLEATEYSENLEQIINDEKVGIIKCRDTFGIVRSPNEAAELRGQVSRYLESYPDHPALLMLRSLSEIFSRDKNSEVTMQNFFASISSALTNYGLTEEITFSFAAWAISKIGEREKKIAKKLIIGLIQTYSNRYLAKILIEKLHIAFNDIPAWFLLANLQEDCKSLILKNGG